MTAVKYYRDTTFSKKKMPGILWVKNFPKFLRVEVIILQKNILDNPGLLGQSTEQKKVERRVLAFDESARYRQVTVTDRNGEVISEKVSRVARQNGSGFVISYTEKMIDFLKKVSTSATVRVFLLLAHRQGYGDNGVYGYRCTRKYLCEVLHVTPKTVWSALDYLIDNFLVVENRFDGQTEFMVNPDYVTLGTNKQARLREWSLRWQMYFKNKERKNSK